MDEDIEKAADIQRDKMLAGMKNKKGGQLNIADISVAYDSKGKVMKLKKLNCDKLPNNGNKPADLVKMDLEQAALRKPSEILGKLKERHDRKRQFQRQGSG